MVFDKPTDIVVILAVFSLVITIIGFAIVDINSIDSSGIPLNGSYFVRVTDSTLSTNGFQGMAAGSMNALSGNNESEGGRTEEGIIKQGFTGILNIGNSWAVMWDEFNEATILLGIPRAIIIIISGLLGISFFVIAYTWIRTRNT